MRVVLTILLLTLLSNSKLIAQPAGPYAPPAGQTGSTAIHKDSIVFVAWANNAIIERGWQNIANKSLGKTTAGTAVSATAKSGINGVVSLGDSGVATLTFPGSLYDGLGADFAVFENGFGSFLELAFVEVSSDGINFFRFDSHSATDTTVQVGSFGSVDATDVHNLAGKYTAGFGTPFDLNELAGTPGLDISNITHIRVVDAIGSLTEPFVMRDSQNRPVNDTWPTPFPTGGFDLDAVGAIHINSNSIDEFSSTSLSTYPNPVNGVLNIGLSSFGTYDLKIIDINGSIILSKTLSGNSHQLNVTHFRSGIYAVIIQSGTEKIVKRIVKN